jgi:hypothetical protein
MSVPVWVLEHTAGAPEVLRARVLDWVRTSGPAAEDDATETVLAHAAVGALRAVLNAAPNRAAALDLLAADALVTLALLARAERDPAALVAWARQLRDAGAACR